MREVGTVDQEERARRLVDYLLTLDIASEVRPSQRGWGIWIHHEDQVEQGRHELNKFLADPEAEKYRAAVHSAREKRKQAERLEREHQKRSVDLGGNRLNTVSFERCPVTFILIGLSLLMAFYSGVGQRRDRLMPFYFAPWRVVTEIQPVQLSNGVMADRPVERIVATLDPIAEGQLWRLFTPMFIHYGLVHLVFNMLWLYWLGGLIELRKNSRLLLLLVLAASPISFLAEYLWDKYWLPASLPPLPGGMSGVIYALFGFIWMKNEYEPESGLNLPPSTIMFMLGWLIICMLGVMGPIANAAHFSGLVFGMLVGLAPHLGLRLR